MEGKYIIEKNGKIIDIRDNIDGPALWRRVSSDDFYIVYGEPGHTFMLGTQNADIQKLVDKINNINDCQNRSRYPYRELKFRVIPRTITAFIDIQNKHWFTDKHRVAYRTKYNC